MGGAYGVSRFTMRDDTPTVHLAGAINQDISPNFRLIGENDELADTRVALYDDETPQEVWHPDLCSILAPWFTALAENGELWAVLGPPRLIELTDDEKQEAERITEHVEAVTATTH